MGSWIHDRFLDSQWVPGFTIGYWIHDRFLDSRSVPGFTVGSWIHDRLVDSRWVPGFNMGSWIHDGFLVLGTARHGNIWHGTDHKGTARKCLAWHGSTRSWHGTAWTSLKTGQDCESPMSASTVWENDSSADPKQIGWRLLAEESWLRNPCWRLLAEDSWLRTPG